MRVSKQKINPILKEQIIKTFAQVIADLKDIKRSNFIPQRLLYGK
jgi:hypothetical protein